MYSNINWAVIIPLANEEKDFERFAYELIFALNVLKSGTAYFIVDNVSIDKTLELCFSLSRKDSRFNTVWAPENKNVVDAYMRGYREAFDNGHDLIIEMDGGLSHDPKVLPQFLKALIEGNECAFGSRFMEGGAMIDSTFFRLTLSKGGTLLANLMLGSKLSDMTSGYQGFQRHVVEEILDYELLSKAHFIQTEIRYLLRNKRFAEIPIHYKFASKRISNKAVLNAARCLCIYFMKSVL